MPIKSIKRSSSKKQIKLKPKKKLSPRLFKSWLEKSSSLLYKDDGTLEKIRGKYLVNEKFIPYFRKPFFEHMGSLSETEKIVTKRLIDIQNPKVLRIFRIGKSYYDAELLDTKYSDKKNIHRDILQNLKELHKMGIIHVDLKNDNIGYSHLDKRWKVFDFNISGIMRSNKKDWLRAPPTWSLYPVYKCIFPAKYGKVVGDEWDNFQEFEKITPLTRIDMAKYKIWTGNC